MENAITSTLFRFVSIRSAQLPDEEEVNIKFIKIGHDLEGGIFYEALDDYEGGSKMLLLKGAAIHFSNPLGSEEHLSSHFEKMYKLSKWILKNRNKDFVRDDFMREVSSVHEPLHTTDLKKVWDNLFYQVITQNSYTTKEICMQLLLAHHVFINHKADDTPEAAEYNMALMHAIVTLPPKLFDENNFEDIESEVPSESIPVPVHPSGPMKRMIEVEASKTKITAYKVLRNEIEIYRNKYKKDFASAYSAAYSVYQSDANLTLESYRMSMMARKKTYYDSKEGKENTLFDPQSPFQRPFLDEAPEIEPFAFSYEEEFSGVTLEANLSAKSYLALKEILNRIPGSNANPSTGGVVPEDPYRAFSDFTTYDELLDEINQGIAGEELNLIHNLTDDPTHISVGGYVTPVGSLEDTSKLYIFQLCLSKTLDEYIFNGSISMPDGFTGPKKIIIKSRLNGLAQPPIEKVLPTLYEGPRSTSFSRFHAFPVTVALANMQYSFLFYFDNNSVYETGNITFSPQSVPSCVRIPVTFSEEAEVPDPDLPVAGNPPFIPSGFGFKEIGIADYKRVEQSIHCYVEGEVSHIENIMAREYKEKSSRSLRKSEQTTTLASETEREKLTDTSTADRFEMQSEVGSVLSESKDFSSFVNTGFSNSGFYLNGGLAFASNTSKENSINQAVTQAKEVTERVLDRVVSKVKEERITKIIEEFEENNKHGFDNRKGSNHVVGVYRWVDKLYKNQIYNYGRRLMFEFMIPEPAKLHVLGSTVSGNMANIDMTPPKDPRSATDSLMKMPNYLSVTELNASYWAGIYDVEIEAKPEEFMSVGESFNITLTGGAILAEVETNSGNGKVAIPNGYSAVSAVGIFNAISDGSRDQAQMISLSIGNITKANRTIFQSATLIVDTEKQTNTDATYGNNFGLQQFEGSVPVAYTLGNHISGDINVTVKCKVKNQTLSQWKQDTFSVIMKGYNDAVVKYTSKLAEEKSKVAETRRTNPGYYRQIENVILRKNCISYLISQKSDAQYTYGKSLSTGNLLNDYEVTVDAKLSEYGSFVKFIEQAFEWEIMSYNFYPFYWGNKKNWDSLYAFDDSDDPVFRSFMQSGMARVIVTVRPGFEAAVQLYMSTGIIWQGGQVPVLGDALYLPLINEMTGQIKAEKEGKAWLSRVPTSLTILQAGSIGLDVEKALPCNCDDNADFENPDQVPCSTDVFTKPDHLIGVTEEDEEEA